MCTYFLYTVGQDQDTEIRLYCTMFILEYTVKNHLIVQVGYTINHLSFLCKVFMDKNFL